MNKGSVEMLELHLLTFTLIENAPLGDHLEPPIQPAGAFDGQVPKRSLRGVLKRVKPQRV